VAAPIRNCTFGFRCRQKWESLEATASERIRHCGACRKDVVWTDTPEALAEALRMNWCVAIPEFEDHPVSVGFPLA
jgi:hypothetical protein